ncbi:MULTISPECIES: V-type ATP synthase subunit E [Mediterraneibacter]|uniref:V-type ATP synthase subunit E n=1 Tax=Mediterraneibacter TaxID=2316020 RepID=UPI0022E7C685|nr:V-type ATP synthase subunit E [Mediterraneibacter massiliensis]
MTLEEKIAHLQATSMEQARSEGNAIIDSYKEALEKVLKDHKEEAIRQSQTRIKAETTNARQQLNQAMAKSQLEIKRQYGKIQLDLKEKIFEEAKNLIDDYMKTESYMDYLIKCIRHAQNFAGEDPVIIYINPSDETKRSDLEDATGLHLTISAEDFIGGVRSVIRARNILIDHSFKTKLRNEYDAFLFLGGDGIA